MNGKPFAIVIVMMTFTICSIIVGCAIIPLFTGVPLTEASQVMVADILKMMVGGVIAYVGAKIQEKTG